MINRKIVIFSSSNAREFQSSVNEFIKDKYVIDIKFQSILTPTKVNGNGVVTDYTYTDRAMVIYEDKVSGE